MGRPDPGTPPALAGARARVARLLLTDGPATASSLARRLGLTSAAIRRTLDELTADGLVSGDERPPFGPSRPRQRGRPARVFFLTAAGHDAFDATYDDLASQLLAFIDEAMGTGAVAEFARRRAHGLEDGYRTRVAEGRDVVDRANTLAELLTADGFAASVEHSAGDSLQICQRHCPISRIAEEFPVLCEAEAAAFARMLDVHVVRLATLARGDGVCTVSVPLSRGPGSSGDRVVGQQAATCAEVGR